MNLICKILSLLFLTILVSCHKDEPSNGIVWDKESENIIKDGIYISHERQTLNLNFSISSVSRLAVHSEYEWLDAYINEEKGQLTVKISSNESYEERTGMVILTIGSRTTKIQIHQKGMYKAIPDAMSYTVSAEGGNLIINLEANGEVEAAVYPEDCKWASISDIQKINDNNWKVTVKAAKNIELGRIASLEFKVAGTIVRYKCGPCIIQEPAPFEENVEINASKPGMLPILLGDNINNLRRIRNITIIGGINGIDFPILKKLLTTEDLITLNQPISVDLSDCAIVAGYKNPFEYYGWVPSGIDEQIPVFYGEIPEGLFTNARNLISIRLPKSLKVIGRMAFSGCSNLESLDIPDIVEEIGAKAFWKCSGIKNINISANSNLISIGNQVFTTGSLIESLSLPEGLTYIAGEAFLGCTVSQLHLHWTDPFEVRIIPNTEYCTLYVPMGTSNIYRNIRNWCNFKQIIEE